jgi:hypothetical protein
VVYYSYVVTACIPVAKTDTKNLALVGGDGGVKGLYNPAFEKTRRKLAERRMLTLREIGERTAIARDVKAFWGQVLGALELNEYDTPYVQAQTVSVSTYRLCSHLLILSLL